VTRRTSAAYPSRHSKARNGQAAGEAIIMAAENRGPLMHAHIGMMLALHGAKPIPE
jgi:hypothetical protein